MGKIVDVDPVIKNGIFSCSSEKPDGFVLYESNNYRYVVRTIDGAKRLVAERA